MKKVLIICGILIMIIIAIVLIYPDKIGTVSPYETKKICFGDVCPDNGGTYVLYKENYTKEQCLEKGGYPVEGYSWGPVYAGCSPYATNSN